MKIQIVCGAGASSTFVATRLRRAATAAGFDWFISPAPLSGLDPAAEVILLGPHLSAELESIALRAPGAHVDVIPEDCLRDSTGEQLLTLTQNGISRARAKGNS